MQWRSSPCRALTSGEIEVNKWDLPTLHHAWYDCWFGGVFRPKSGSLVGLYVYGSLEKVILNVNAPDLAMGLQGWENDEDGFNSQEAALWAGAQIDIDCLRPAADSLLALLSVG